MKEITFDDFCQLYQKEPISVLDVRESREFARVHLNRAQNLPLSGFLESYKELDKEQIHYIICKSGLRSARACQFLSEQGYQTINVQGGMDAFE